MEKIYLLLLGAATLISSPAQTYSTLVNFSGANGEGPLGGLVQGANGNLYGTTTYAGTCALYLAGCGSVFETTPSGTLTTLHFFTGPDGALPYTALLLGADGNFYGTTSAGGANCASSFGCGTLFKITPGGDLTTLYSFCSLAGCADGNDPAGGLIQATDGSFYGTTFSGGSKSCSLSSGGCGTIFRFVPGGMLTTVHSFGGSPEGLTPAAGLVRGADGNLYGTTLSGGASGYGTIFRFIQSSQTVNTMHSFCSQPGCADGAVPAGTLIEATDRSLYGATSKGGSAACHLGCGTLFKITTRGGFTTLHSFVGTDGSAPLGGLIEATDGNLFGTTVQGGSDSCALGCGTVFEITFGGDLTTLYSFSSASVAADVRAPLMQSTNRTFYGTSFVGGSNGVGTVFSLSSGLGPFVKAVPHAGAPGAAVRILGSALTGTSSVSFNGTGAEFTVVSDTEIVTTVPAAATSGGIQVAAPGGALFGGPFVVLP